MLEGKVCLITGSTDGLGREVALRMGAAGAAVIVHGRDPERGAAVVSRINDRGPGSACFYRADLASLSEVRDLSRQIKREHRSLDFLINNAGLGSTRSGRRELSVDGHELIFAVNYLAGFLLTRELLPLIRRSTPSSIINVSSIGQAPLDFDNLMLERGYEGMHAYCQSKLAQIMMTIDLAAELEGTGVTVNCLHPAAFMDTRMVTAAGYEPQTSVDEGADAVMQLVSGARKASGQFFNGKNLDQAHEQAYDRASRERLKSLSLDLTGTSVTVRESLREELPTFFEMERRDGADRFVAPNTLAEHQSRFDGDEGRYLSILYQDRLVGFMLLIPEPDGPSVDFKRIVVAERGKGIGQAAIVQMEEYCRVQLGRKRVWLNVFDYNERGRHVYEKLGYQFFKTEDYFGKTLRYYEKAF